MNESEPVISSNQEEVKRQRRLEKYRKYYRTHQKKVKEYYLKNKSKFRERNKKWKLENPIRVQELRSKQYWKDPEKARKQARKDGEKRKDIKMKRGAEWRAKNRSKIKAYDAKRRQTPQGKLDAIHAAHRRKARKNNCPFPITRAELKKIRDAGTECFYCKNSKSELTLDHFIPLSRGGAHSKENLVIACRSCNSSKGDKDPHEFLRSIGRLL